MGTTAPSSEASPEWIAQQIAQARRRELHSVVAPPVTQTEVALRRLREASRKD